MWRYRFRRSTLWLTGYMAVLAGIGIAHAGLIVPMVLVFGLTLAVLLRLRNRNSLTLLLVVLLGVGCGCWRGAVYMQKQAVYDKLYYHKITLLARANNDGVYGKHSQISFDAGSVVLANGQKLAGKVQVSGFGLNAVYQGDEVEASGKLYPGFGAYQGRISFAHLQVVGHHPSLVAQIRRKFTAAMQSVLPEPLAPFAMGLLVGQRATLPADVKQDLLRVGLTHIIAVSGYNLTIMLHASRRVLGKRSKRIGTLLSLSLIGAFLLLAGSSASIVRAAIVSVLSIFAGYYGRSFRPLNLIVLAAAITAWANPFYLWGDISWYLSFLAFYGVMVLAPLLQSRFRQRWRDSLVLGVALESLCAEAMTLPFVLHTFGQMSFVGLPANVLVVTLVPLAMLLSLIAGLSGMLAGSVAGWLAWPARLLLTYMLDIAHLLAHLPHIFVQHLALPLLQMLGLYGVLATLTILLKGKTKPLISDRITDRNTTIGQGAEFERT